MIKTVADLLKKFIELEAKALDGQSISHPPTIGAMYEGLTRKVLNSALPTNADLTVSDGFARGSDGVLSKQLDCILAIGPGEAVPHTDKKIHDVGKIVAAIEVKKNLYQPDIGEGIENLKSIVNLSSSAGKTPPIFRTIFQGMTRTVLPRDPSKLSPELHQYYHLLLMETVRPVRILLGYHGYSNENTLRRGVLDHLEKFVGTKGSGPRSLPSLIMNQNASVIKANGLPWSAPIQKGWWHLLQSTSSIPPVRVLLESIWSRLNYLGMASPSIFGEDLEIEDWHHLIDVQFDAKKKGWRFRASPARVSVARTSPGPSWEPFVLTEDQWVIANLLCNLEEIDIATFDFGGRPRTKISADFRAMGSMGLVGPVPGKQNTYGLLTVACAVAVLPDGRFIAGENVSGRLTRWAERFMRDWAKSRK